MTLGSDLPFLGLIYKMATVKPAQSRGEGSRGLRPGVLCSGVDWVATRGHCCLRNAPRPQAVGSARRLAPGPPGQTHPSRCGLLTGQPHPHLLHLLGACCTPSPLHTSRQSRQSDQMISILQMEEPRLPGLGPSRPQGVHRRLCLSPPHIRVSIASGSEWISSIRHH